MTSVARHECSGDPMAKLIPNTHQTPNYYIDEGIMNLLTGLEYKCLSFACRKTFGWHKIDATHGVYADRIAKSQFMDATGASNEAITKALQHLCLFGLMILLEKNDPKNNHGILYGMQLDEGKINW